MNVLKAWVTCIFLVNLCSVKAIVNKHISLFLHAVKDTNKLTITVQICFDFPQTFDCFKDAFSSFNCNILIQNRSNLQLTSKRFLQIICFLNIVITFHSHVMFHFINKKMTFIFSRNMLRYTHFYSCILGRCYHKEIKKNDTNLSI